MAAVFVADGKAVQQIFDGDEAGVFEVCSPAGADALQQLQGRRQEGVNGVRPLFFHCTIIA